MTPLTILAHECVQTCAGEESLWDVVVFAAGMFLVVLPIMGIGIGLMFAALSRIRDRLW